MNDNNYYVRPVVSFPVFIVKGISKAYDFYL